MRRLTLLVAFCSATGCGRIAFNDQPPGDTGGSAADARCVASAIHFSPPASYPTAGNPRSVAIADLDHDGRLDLILASSAGATMFFGIGGGAFEAGPTVPSPPGHNSMTMADLDGDSYPDVVIGGAQSFCVLLNHHDRTFGSCVPYATGRDANSAASGALDVGGSIDIVIGNQIDDNVGIYINSGTGTLTELGVWGTGGTNAYSEVIGHFDTDGFGDIISANLLSDNIALLHGSSTGTPSAPTKYTTGSHPMAVAARDLDGDGDLDVIAGTWGSVDVFLNQGDGTLAPRVPLATTVVLNNVNSVQRMVAIGDFDGDGRPDLACTNATDNTIGAYTNLGGGSFAPVLSFPAGTNPWAIAAGDLDGNGLDDLVVSASGDNALAVLLAQCP